MVKSLHLSWTKHPHKKHSGKQFLDFIVSGESLRSYLGLKNNLTVTPFGFFPSKEEEKRNLQEFRLQQKTQLEGNRIELYICEDCGDIGCGAVTAKIIDRGDKIIWTEFANQSTPEEIHSQINVEEIEFDRQDYFKALEKIY